MSIRKLVLVAFTIVAVLAGCLGGPSGSSPSGTDGVDRSANGTDWMTPFPETTVEWPEGPKARPDRPDEMTTETVREFVRTHEYRYAYNSLWASERTNVTVDCSVDSVTPNRSGYSAAVSCYGYSETPIDDGNETLHADWFKQTYRYDVDETTIRRVPVDRFG